MSCRITSKDYLDRNDLTNQVVKQIQRHEDIEEICISDIMDSYVAEWENEIEKCYSEIADKEKIIVEQTVLMRELCVEKCRTCIDYNLCCEIGRCGNCNEGCYRKSI